MKVKCGVCGFLNEKGTQTCITCGGDISPSTSDFKKTIISNGPNARMNTKNTIISNFNHGIEKLSEPNHCGQCGYPIMPGANVCPACGHSNGDDRNIDSSSSPSLVKSSGTKSTKRLDDFAKEEEVPILKLIPLNSKKTNVLSSTEGSIRVSREDLDVMDESISAKQHLAIDYINGAWYLKNLATNQAVFIQVNDKVQLSNNQILLVGEKKLFRVVIENDDQL